QPTVTVLILALFWFFSSRRRHTSFSRDWSSDVCSSDLLISVVPNNPLVHMVAYSRGSELRSHRAEEGSVDISVTLAVCLLGDVGDGSCAGICVIIGAGRDGGSRDGISMYRGRSSVMGVLDGRGRGWRDRSVDLYVWRMVYAG